MHSRLVAKNIGDVFLRRSVYFRIHMTRAGVSMYSPYVGFVFLVS